MSDYNNFLQDIEAVVKGEQVTAVAWLADRGENYYGYSRPKYHCSTDWEAVKFLFDYEYNTGYGGVDCHAILIWTVSRIIFVQEYDGATDVQSLPLSFINMKPDDVRFV